jgi:hypothetical protein
MPKSKYSTTNYHLTLMKEDNKPKTAEEVRSTFLRIRLLDPLFWALPAKEPGQRLGGCRVHILRKDPQSFQKRKTL